MVTGYYYNHGNELRFVISGYRELDEPWWRISELVVRYVPRVLSLHMRMKNGKIMCIL